MSTIVESPETPPVSSGAICWRVWPLQQPRLALPVAVGFVAAGVLAYFAVASLIMTLLALIALGLAGWQFFVPIEFVADEGGVKRQWLGRQRYVDWTSFRAFSSLAHGFILWPSEDYCPLDAVRGQFLPCPREKAALTELLRRHLAESP